MRRLAFAAAACMALVSGRARAADPEPLRSLAVAQPAATLDLHAILQPSRGGPALSPRVRALDGKRVRVVGFMAQMEEPPLGAFYLVARPVFCDEGGAGMGDLPPDAIRVVVRSSPDVPITFVPGRLEVTGLLRVGNRADAEGRVSALELLLDTDAPAASRPQPPSP